MARLKVLRKVPRKAGPGRVFFNRQGMPISIRNSPNARRIRKKHRG